MLVFVALRDRKAEIILGDGIDDRRQVEASQRIMNTVMVPEFRAGNFERAALQGALACAIDISGVRIEKPHQPARAESTSPVNKTSRTLQSATHYSEGREQITEARDSRLHSTSAIIVDPF